MSGRDVDGGWFDGIGDGFDGCSSNAGSCFFERLGGSFDGALVYGCCGAFVYCGGNAKLIALITLRYRDTLIGAAGQKAVGATMPVGLPRLFQDRMTCHGFSVIFDIK